MTWLKGQKEIKRKVRVEHWTTVEKLIAAGAPIARVAGMWLAQESVLDEWLTEQIEKERGRMRDSAPMP